MKDLPEHVVDRLFDLIDKSYKEKVEYGCNITGDYDIRGITRGNAIEVLLDKKQKDVIGSFHTHVIQLEEPISDDDILFAISRDDELLCVGDKGRKKRIVCYVFDRNNTLYRCMHDIVKKLYEDAEKYRKYIIEKYGEYPKDEEELWEMVTEEEWDKYHELREKITAVELMADRFKDTLVKGVLKYETNQ